MPINKKNILLALVIVGGILFLGYIVISMLFSSDNKTKNSSSPHSIIQVEEGNSNELPSFSNENQQTANESNQELTTEIPQYYSDVQLQDAKNKAQNFIGIVLNFERENPLKYLEPTEEILKLTYTDTLKVLGRYITEEVDEKTYPVKNIKKRIVEKTEIIESDYYNPVDIYINVLATVTTQYLSGNTKKETILYNVYFEKNLEKEFKISEIYIFE